MIGITHFSKNSRSHSVPLDRINGSGAFGFVARMAWAAVAPDEGNEPRRFVRMASNIAPMGGGFEYTLVQAPVPGYPHITSQKLVWGARVEGAAKALISEVQGEEEKAGKLREAKAFLQMMLAEGQALLVADIKKAAEAHGVVWRTVLRAKDALGVIPKPRPGAFPAVYDWRLPPRASSGGDIEY